MVFKAAGKQYSYPTDWKDIELGKYCTFLTDIEPTRPETLDAILMEADDDKRRQKAAELSDVDYTHEILPYYAKYVAFWTGMSYKMIMGIGKYRKATGSMDPKTLEALWWKIESGVFLKTEVDENLDKFVHKGRTYYLPEKHMEKSTVIEFMEAAQLEAKLNDLSKGNWNAMPYVLAVIARPKNEIYNSRNTERRAAMFQTLTMDIVRSVAFFLQKLNAKSAPDSLIFTISHHLSKLRQVSTT